jgi:predicted RNase H-like HicB family nuclease
MPIAPALKSFGAVTWGQSRAEALKHIREVVELVVAELVEDGVPLRADAGISPEPLVAVTV